MQVRDKDQQFLQRAASDGLAEVQMEQMAAERTTNPEVQRFGQSHECPSGADGLSTVQEYLDTQGNNKKRQQTAEAG